MNKLEQLNINNSKMLRNSPTKYINEILYKISVSTNMYIFTLYTYIFTLIRT